MTPVSGITNRVSTATSSRRIAEPSADAPATSSNRSLIALQPIHRGEPTPPLLRRPRADFLAHLIATAERLPQTREKRRADPDVAIQAYVKARDAGRAGVTARLELTA
jgi:hypothetical protein